jgi:hypothetical protein
MAQPGPEAEAPGPLQGHVLESGREAYSIASGGSRGLNDIPLAEDLEMAQENIRIAKRQKYAVDATLVFTEVDRSAGLPLADLCNILTRAGLIVAAPNGRQDRLVVEIPEHYS